jgi:hypothetical protein
VNFKEFEILTMAKSFVELYQHHFRLFLIAKGYFSKNLPHHTLHEICRRFCEIVQFPSEILVKLQSKEVNLDELGIIGHRALELMSQISEVDIINAFSQITTIEVH